MSSSSAREAVPPASPAACGVGWNALKGTKVSNLSLSFLQEKLNFPTTTPVQARTIPLLLNHRDVVVEAMTGSGKTLAYLVPTLEMILTQRGLQSAKSGKNAILAIVVLPSRELAIQVHEIAKLYLTHVNKGLVSNPPCREGKGVQLSTACFIGGRDIAKDLDVFSQNGANILIGTPGRLFELLVASKHSTAFDVSKLELLILDEADKLLDYGFKAKLDALFKRLPKQRRTGLFSATQTRELADIARAGMRNPVAVTVRTSNVNAVAPAARDGGGESKPQVPEQLENFYLTCKLSEKHDYLVKFLNDHPNDKVLIYVLTCAAVDWLAMALPEMLTASLQGTTTTASAGGTAGKSRRTVMALHGQMPLNQRAAVNKTFRTEACSSAILLCTDVAARGLDIPEVGIVVQYEAPVAPSTFIHRIGRTARMGRSGMSLLFLTTQESEYVEFMKLQHVRLQPLALEEESDDDDEGDAMPGEVDVKKTLASARPKLKGRGRGITKQAKKTSAQRKRPRDDEEIQVVNAADLPCESPAILALRRTSIKTPKITELALRAFVSFLRAYKEHECSYIFQLRKVDIVDLVHFFALFSLPSCGELRRMGRLRIPLQPEFDNHVAQLRAVAKAKAEERAVEKEEQMRRKEEEQALEESSNRKKSLAAQTHDRKEAIKSLGLSQKKAKVAWKQAELDELMRESYLVKKEKRGDLTQKRVDELSGHDTLENSVLSTRERAEKRKALKQKKY